MIFRNGFPLCCITSLPLVITRRNAQNLVWTNFQKMSLTKQFQTRNTASFPRNTRKIYVKDKVPNDYNLIYHAPLINYVTFSQCLSVFSAVSVSICTFFYLYSDKQTDPLKLCSIDIITGTDDLIVFNVFSIFLTWIIMFVSRKCTLSIYHSPLKNNYVALFPSFVPFERTKITFDKAVKDNSLSFVFKDVSYKLGTKKAYLLDHYFKCPMDLTEMLDEPSKQ